MPFKFHATGFAFYHRLPFPDRLRDAGGDPSLLTTDQLDALAAAGAPVEEIAAAQKNGAIAAAIGHWAEKVSKRP